MELTETAKLRRMVLTSIARFTLNDQLPERIYDILYRGSVTEDSPRYRCCVHKERAVLKNRIDMAFGLKVGINIIDAAKIALVTPVDTTLPILDVLPVACDQCPIDKYMVTNACRHCISHKCIDDCPKKAISIHQNRAFIDKNKCIECGRCKNACPYGVIVEISRPCERACALGAISAGDNHKAIIDFDKCVQCGACRNACPFGAIDERSSIVQLIQTIKHGHKMVALVAPSIVSQFGFKTQFGQILTALHKFGFHEIVEVGVGADITSVEEAREFIEKVPQKQPYLTSSCCPSFVKLVKQHYPAAATKVSDTPSPMVSCGKMIKQADPNAKTVFIGPCIAKKAEARRHRDVIDFVLTFEELMCLFDGAGIDVAKQPLTEHNTAASAIGLKFPLHGGVSQAVSDTVEQLGGREVVAHYAAGIDNCLADIEKADNGEIKCNYFEGMACDNGCIDGPGTIIDYHLSNIVISKYADKAKFKRAAETEHAE